ncbi:MAG TPA: tripartite tricarboxylate transporter substrate binding protein [Burkholderiales bacterium]|nr:tripartite tricarboxylate transporter substrate binding protein [Burkholderiales bacterium]
MHRLFVVVLGFTAALHAGGVLAQAYPAKPVRLIVTYPPGGSSDLMARVFGQKLSEIWGQPVIVESKPGAAGSIGMEYASKQPADGYNFVIGNIGPAAVNPLMTKVPYDVERDFVAISLIATGPNVLIVNPGVPAKSFRELIDLAKTNSGKLNYGSSGPGSVSQLAGEMLKILAGVQAVEVPYKGGILAVQDVVGGHLQFIFADSLPSMQFIKAEKVRPLCVTSPQRSPLVPNLPPCAETLPGLVAISWWGVFMPTGVPKAILDQFHGDLVKALQDPDVKRKFADLGVDAVHDTPEEFVAFIKSETVKYGKLIKDVGIKAE